MEEATIIDIENICRACSQESQNLVSIFEVFYQNIQFQHILHSIAPISTILEDDGLPYKICDPCREKAIEAYNFRQLLISSDENMRTLCEEVKIKEEFDSDDGIYQETQESFENMSSYQEEDYYEEPEERPKKSSRNKGFTCTICDKSHVSASKLLRHLKVHKGLTDEEKSDMLCGNIPKREPAKNPRPRKFHCSMCSKSFESPSKLARHMSVHSKEGFSVKQEEEEVEQKSPRKYNTGKILCDKCSRKFSSKVAYERHLFTHSAVFEQSKIKREESHDYVCVICSTTFNDYEYLFIHMRDHKDVEETQHQGITCQLCLKTFFSIKNIIRHSKTHDENATHQCIHCGRKYGYGEDFIDHMLRHDESKLFRCDICNKAFVKLHKLRQHVVGHTQNSKPYLCPQCGKAFAEIDYLKRHLMRHTGIKNHKCPLCPSAFTFRGGLTTHLKTHSGLKPFVCNICGSTFTREDTLKKHIKNHAGEIEKKYACDVCGKGFVAPFNLKTHMRIHTGEKPFACEFCDRSYSQKNDLVKHLRIHVGQNTYKCQHCDMAFRLNAELKNHMLIHYRENPALCEQQQVYVEVMEEDRLMKI